MQQAGHSGGLGIQTINVTFSVVLYLRERTLMSVDHNRLHLAGAIDSVTMRKLSLTSLDYRYPTVMFLGIDVPKHCFMSCKQRFRSRSRGTVSGQKFVEKMNQFSR